MHHAKDRDSNHVLPYWVCAEGVLVLAPSTPGWA